MSTTFSVGALTAGILAGSMDLVTELLTPWPTP